MKIFTHFRKKTINGEATLGKQDISLLSFGAVPFMKIVVVKQTIHSHGIFIYLYNIHVIYLLHVIYSTYSEARSHLQDAFRAILCKLV